MGFRPIAFVTIKSISGINLMVFHHNLIPGHFGQYGSSGDGYADSVSVYDGSLWNRYVRKSKAVDKDMLDATGFLPAIVSRALFPSLSQDFPQIGF